MEEPSEKPASNVTATPPCTVCGSTEPPDVQGLCPTKTCRATRAGNKLAAIHDGRAKLTAADLSARDALMDRLFRERGGRSALDIVSQLRVEDYATAQIQLGRVTRRLEDAGAVSQAGNERKSLVSTYNTFSARVERLAAELPPPLPSGSMPSELDAIDSLNDDQLIERTARTLKMLLLLRDSRVDDAPVNNAGLAVMADSSTSSEEEAPTPAPAPEPDPYVPECEFCRRRPCVGVDHVAYDVLHWRDPNEVKKRDEEATKVMLAQISKPLPPWYSE